MQSSVNNSKQNSLSTSPKSKRNAAKDKEKLEKRRSDNYSGKMDPSEVLAFLMSETNPTKQYARLARESVLNYADQTIFEHPSHEISYSLAEDLSYKLRHIIHDAQVKAQLCGRTAFMACDVDAAFENLTIDKVYGASNYFNFIPFNDKNHYYLDDTIVNLAELAEETGTLIQPGNVTLAKKCYPESNPTMKNYVTYFDTMCRALICNTPKLQQEALWDIRRNPQIGPIVNWFYNFGYFLLAKDITYDSLTLSALDLIQALENNPIAIQLVSEKELKLLVRLILQRLLRTQTTYEVIKPMGCVLTILCRRAPLREFVIKKIAQRQQSMNTCHALALISIINELGAEALNMFIDHLFYLLRFIRGNSSDVPDNLNLVQALMRSYRILCINHDINMDPKISLHCMFYEIFNYMLTPLWINHCCCSVEKLETNWRNIKAQLLKTRRKLPPTQTQMKKYNINEVFDSPIMKRKSISFKNSEKVRHVWNKQHVIMDTQELVKHKTQEFVTVGRWSNYYDVKPQKLRSCINYASINL